MSHVRGDNSWTFQEWLDEQRNLQIDGHAYGKTEGDPAQVCKDPEAMARHYQWNFAAAVGELVELMDEVGWKPWATSRHVNRQQVMAEAVDVLHFLGNMLLGVGATGAEISELYEAKIQKNLQRWQNDYDGVSGKCGDCGRDLTELPPDHIAIIVDQNTGRTLRCGLRHHNEGYL